MRGVQKRKTGTSKTAERNLSHKFTFATESSTSVNLLERSTPFTRIGSPENNNNNF